MVLLDCHEGLSILSILDYVYSDPVFDLALAFN